MVCRHATHGNSGSAMGGGGGEWGSCSYPLLARINFPIHPNLMRKCLGWDEGHPARILNGVAIQLHNNFEAWQQKSHPVCDGWCHSCMASVHVGI